MEEPVNSASQAIAVYNDSAGQQSQFSRDPGSLAHATESPAEANRFTIYLRLRTAGMTLKKARINRGGSWGAFIPMPWIHQNCLADCETCFHNKNYQPIMDTTCDDSAFTLELHFQSDADPNRWGRTAHSITPDCSHTGQVECVQ